MTVRFEDLLLSKKSECFRATKRIVRKFVGLRPSSEYSLSLFKSMTKSCDEALDSRQFLKERRHCSKDRQFLAT